jgi:thiol-disulfide isomerase/thioredoxin
MVFLNIDESTNNKIKNMNHENMDDENMDDESMDDENMDDENTDNKRNKKQLTELLSDYIRDDKQIFILIYMDGCGPCNETRPEWKKIKNVLKKYKNNKDVIIVDIEHQLLDKVKNNNISPVGFPTIKYISNGGKTIKDYDEVDTKDEKRTIGSFVQWIEGELKKNHNQEGGKKSKTKKNKTKKNKTNKNKNKKHKWSMKYKKSINCKSPKGFSQKQFCKYNKMNKKNI